MWQDGLVGEQRGQEWDLTMLHTTLTSALASAPFWLALSLTSAPEASMTWYLNGPEANQTIRP